MSNIWREFERLLPQAPLLTGKVISRQESGDLIVELPGGGQLRVTGEAELGQRVFVKADQVIGEAPELPFVEIEI
ncbi:hypothetical protein D5085_07785 [Ectothiorhodospiraceae bacterium BW-2]|nr:hypothetical protein D5085_07785 [Ectothiorhodospiraceae bacterium BW-2]